MYASAGPIGPVLVWSSPPDKMPHVGVLVCSFTYVRLRAVAARVARPQRWTDRRRGDACRGVQHRTDHGWGGFGEDRRRQRGEAVAERSGAGDVPGLPGRDQRGVVAGGDVRRGEEAAVPAEFEQRRGLRVFAAEHRVTRWHACGLCLVLLRRRAFGPHCGASGGVFQSLSIVVTMPSAVWGLPSARRPTCVAACFRSWQHAFETRRSAPSAALNAPSPTKHRAGRVERAMPRSGNGVGVRSGSQRRRGAEAHRRCRPRSRCRHR
ncbi:hypothetical protein GA0070214_103185 [Micromonospora chaiyaphumensis]|uniref:Uncharacterized protein n=1 Tax=Micromonospora chaiyaphumensis TaxID=307119 RepID=A0A1C4W3V2_9ACTN|nr:hypothetical protein GA0070214_103185 [Micromonospora chaiyaphumensis]